MSTIENKDILFIINPNSGRKKAEKLLTKIKKISTGFSAIITTDKKDFKQVLTGNIEKFKLFVLVGGDGTVNSAVQHFIDKKDKILAIYPAGSGNGLARELGYKPSLPRLLSAFQNPEFIEIDVIEVNNHLCVNMAGIGFDSFVAHQFQQMNGRGLKNYILATIKSVFIFKPFNATILTDNHTFQGKYQMISIANTRQFGNNAFISPQSKPNDGIFELVLVKPFPLYLYPAFIIRLFTNSLKTSKYIDFIPVKNQAEIISDFNQYHIDGEPKQFSGKIKFKITGLKLRLLKVF
ncbi:MAG: hypothetical protein JXR61_08200 [Prolixibacteraceae bacterium]|nr:hypothetical protein [Prolixibacteraceae bacterium]